MPAVGGLQFAVMATSPAPEIRNLQHTTVEALNLSEADADAYFQSRDRGARTQVRGRSEHDRERQTQQIECSRQSVATFSPHPATQQQERRGDREQHGVVTALRLGLSQWCEPDRAALAGTVAKDGDGYAFAPIS